MILCDTNVLIEFYKGNPAVVETLRAVGVSDLAISVVSSGELYFGAKDKSELRKIQKNLALLHQLPLDADISSEFLKLLGDYALSHKLSVPDALIAATALIYSLPLYTLNVKDFRFIAGVNLYKP